MRLEITHHWRAPVEQNLIRIAEISLGLKGVNLLGIEDLI